MEDLAVEQPGALPASLQPGLLNPLRLQVLDDCWRAGGQAMAQHQQLHCYLLLRLLQPRLQPVHTAAVLH